MPRIDLDDYQLGPVLGAGSAGTIYEARHKQSGQLAALKLLSPAVSRDPLVVSRFIREMTVLEKLHHPHIVAYYGGGRHDGQLFYVMELIEGGTLKQLLAAHGPIPWEEACEVARQVASALQHAHNHGIIHRDLKPGNIFLTLDGTCKLGDFGIARDLKASDITDTGLTVGTYAYMAPELVQGRRAITGQVDLYALGCVLFEILVGRPPFSGDNFAEIFHQHLHAAPPRIRQLGVDCPSELEDLLLELLAKSPEDRPFNARTVQGKLTELCAGAGRVVQVLGSEPAESWSADRPAAAVRLLQDSLRQRIAGAIARRNVRWPALLVLSAIVVAVVAAGIWMRGG